MIRAVILLVLAACASSKSAEQHAEVAAETHTEAQAAQTLQQETHSEEGGWTRRTWEYGAPQAEGSEVHAGGLPALQAPQATGSKGQAPGQRPAAAPDGGVGHPSFLGWPMDGDAPLLRYTEETHAPAHVDTTTVAGATQATKQDTSLKAASEAHSASKWRVGLPWLSLAALAVGLALAWKTGWLGKGLGLLGKVF